MNRSPSPAQSPAAPATGRYQKLLGRGLGAGLCLLLTGCTPKINVNLGTVEPAELVPKTVLEDPGSADGTIAMIDVRGLISDVRLPGLLGPSPSPVDQLVARLNQAEKDPSIKAVILRINSPGGTVTGSDIMFREVRRFATTTRKPVVASLGEIAASGGYYLACSADKIVTQPTTITASIGVIIPTMNFSDGLSRIGIKSRDVISGPNKNLASPFAPMHEAHYAVLQGIVDEFYSRFKGVVVERRPSFNMAATPEAVDGRVVTGARAVAIGLADQEGGVREAFQLAKDMASLKSARLVKYAGEDAKPRTPYASIDDATPSASNGPGEINLVQIKLDGMTLPGVASGASGVYYLWTPGAE